MILGAIIIFVLIAIDQKTKSMAVKYFEARFNFPIYIGFIQFVIVKNTGAAFGFLKKRQDILKMIIPILILNITVYFIFLIFKGDDKLIYPLSFVIGGAASNYIDRIRRGYVVDFFTLKLKKFPVMNLADLFIFLGSIAYILNY